MYQTRLKWHTTICTECLSYTRNQPSLAEREAYPRLGSNITQALPGRTSGRIGYGDEEIRLPYISSRLIASTPEDFLPFMRVEY